MGHRRFLDVNHPFRKDSGAFDGTEEVRMAPPNLSGSKVLRDLAGHKIIFGKLVDDNPTLPFNWKKLSIFFQLPYWRDNLLRHNLDVMHIEKNVCDNVLGSLLNLDGKTKDHLKARLDIEEMGIRHELHPVRRESNKIYLPPACFLMDKKEKEIFCGVLKGVKVPDGYSSNISRCVNVRPLKISGLKSHDSHVMMQQLLPLALRRVLPKHVRSALLKLSQFFRELCAKVLRPQDLIRLETEIAVTLCELERIFPPSFFDVMVHLTVHLVAEARIAGPVHYRWMYPVERYLSTLKSYVRNRTRPEGSIAEGYIADECVNFSSFYFADDVETRLNRQKRNSDGAQGGSGLSIFSMLGRPIGGVTHDSLDDEVLAKAHLYVLFNCADVDPLITENMASNIRNTRQSTIEGRDEHHQIPSPVLDDNQDADSTQPRRKVRGPTRMTKIWGSSANQIKIKCNELGQPICDNTSTLTHFIGTIARNGRYTPIDKGWKNIDRVHKEDMLNTVYEKFDVPPEIEDWLLLSFAKKLRSWRSKVKKLYYNPDLSVEAQIRNCPKDVEKSQWKNLLTRWQSENAQKISEQNKKNRKSKRMNHTSGKKSFARIRAKKKEELGHEPGRADMFIEVYKIKKSDATSEETTAAIEQMYDKLSELPPDLQDETTQNDVFAQVLGQEKDSRIRTYGLGVLQSDILGTNISRRASRREALQCKNKVEQLLAKNDLLEAKNEELEARMARMEQLLLNGFDRSVPRHETVEDTSNIHRTVQGHNATTNDLSPHIQLPQSSVKPPHETRPLGGHNARSHRSRVLERSYSDASNDRSPHVRLPQSSVAPLHETRPPGHNDKSHQSRVLEKSCSDASNDRSPHVHLPQSSVAPLHKTRPLGGHNDRSHRSTMTKRVRSPRVQDAQCSKSSKYTNRPIKVNDHVHLKSIIDPRVVVAKGIVSSMNPSMIVGGEELGENWCEVLTQVVVHGNERLIRPYGIFKTIGDSIGASVAWPMTLVIEDDT